MKIVLPGLIIFNQDVEWKFIENSADNTRWRSLLNIHWVQGMKIQWNSGVILGQEYQWIFNGSREWKFIENNADNIGTALSMNIHWFQQWKFNENFRIILGQNDDWIFIENIIDNIGLELSFNIHWVRLHWKFYCGNCHWIINNSNYRPFHVLFDMFWWKVVILNSCFFDLLWFVRILFLALHMMSSCKSISS